MQGSPEVIEALNQVYQLLAGNEVQAHLQEHVYESESYKKISAWFDVIETNGHEVCTHYVMKRINALGGECATEWGFQPDPARPIEQLDAAINGQIQRLTDIHRAYVVAGTMALAAKDWPTLVMVADHLRWVEKHLGKFEDRQAQIQELTLEGYLQEMFNK